jgi:hypothetical protein
MVAQFYTCEIRNTSSLRLVSTELEDDANSKSDTVKRHV